MTVKRIPLKEGKPFVIEHHYSKGCQKSATTFGCYHGERLVGVCAFATPCGENVRSWVFGAADKSAVTELHRLVMLGEDVWLERPRNALSWFVKRCLELLPIEKPLIRAVVTYADTSEEHTGAIYRALNALYYGFTGKSMRFYKDKLTGRLHHPRFCGVNISLEEAESRGWEPVKRGLKHKYVFLVGTRQEIRDSRDRLSHQPISWIVENNSCVAAEPSV